MLFEDEFPAEAAGKNPRDVIERGANAKVMIDVKDGRVFHVSVTEHKTSGAGPSVSMVLSS